MTKRAILWIAVSSGTQASDDKQSLPEQDHRLREIAEANNWKVVDVITVPGHSRVYYNYREFAEAALDEGIPAPFRMFEHWKKKDFDVFACASGDRFGREQSIFAEVVGRTIDTGAVVYTMRDGEINQNNKRMFVSMAGYQASVEIDELRRRYKFGMNRRAEEGKPVSSRVLFSHRVVRDQLGHAQTMIVRDELRPLFSHIATLLLDRTPWYALEKELFEQYGYVAENGKPYPNRFFYPVIYSPVFWGHNGRNFANRRVTDARRISAWIFDDKEPCPEGVLMFYHTHEPVYTDELAEQVKAELRRRMTLRGAARTDSPYPLSGLFECAECGHKMAWTLGSGNYRAARCNVAYGLLGRTNDTCTQRKHMTEAYAINYLKRTLKLLSSAEDPIAFLNQLSDVKNIPDETPMLKKQLEELEEEGRVLLQLRLKTRQSVDKLFEEQWDLLGKRVEIVEERLVLAQRAKPTVAEIADQRDAIEEMRVRGETFWELPPGRINQVLRRALGRRIMQVREGKIKRFKYIR